MQAMTSTTTYHPWRPTERTGDLARKFLEWIADQSRGREASDRPAVGLRVSMTDAAQLPRPGSGGERYTLTSKGWMHWLPKSERDTGPSGNWGKNRKKWQGRPPSSQWYMEQVISPALNRSLPLVLYPGHFGLCVIDIDSPTLDNFLHTWPPIFHLFSSSCFSTEYLHPSDRDKGHAFFRQPRDVGKSRHQSFLNAFGSPDEPLSLDTTGMRVSLKGVNHKFDYCHKTRSISVAPHQFETFFSAIVELSLPPPVDTSRPGFPYSFISLMATEGSRHHVLLSGIWRARVDAEGITPEQETIWRDVIDELGYDRSFEDLTQNIDTDPAVGVSDNLVSFDHEGLGAIVAAEKWRLRFAVRANGAEIYLPDMTPSVQQDLSVALDRPASPDAQDRPDLMRGQDDKDWHLVDSEAAGTWLRSHLRKSWRIPTAKDSKPFETKTQWPMVEEWFGTVARDPRLGEGDYSPFTQLIRGCYSSDPLPDLIPPYDEPGFIEQFVDLPTCLPPLLRRGLLRALRILERYHHYTYVRRLIRSAAEQFRCPYLICFVGPTGVGKSRYWEWLGYIHYHTHVEIGKPPKEVGEKVQQGAVHEVVELKEQFSGRSRQASEELRGYAKSNLERTKFTFRRSGAHGFAKDYFLTGVFGGSSQAPLKIDSTDGLARRIFQFPVRRHPDISPSFKEWNARWMEYYPRMVHRILNGGQPPPIDGYETQLARLCLAWPDFIELTGDRSEEPDNGWRVIDSEFDDIGF